MSGEASGSSAKAVRKHLLWSIIPFEPMKNSNRGIDLKAGIDMIACASSATESSHSV